MAGRGMGGVNKAMQPVTKTMRGARNRLPAYATPARGVSLAHILSPPEEEE